MTKVDIPMQAKTEQKSPRDKDKIGKKVQAMQKCEIPNEGDIRFSGVSISWWWATSSSATNQLDDKSKYIRDLSKIQIYYIHQPVEYR